jgi:hypothetical protein
MYSVIVLNAKINLLQSFYTVASDKYFDKHIDVVYINTLRKKYKNMTSQSSK